MIKVIKKFAEFLNKYDGVNFSERTFPIGIPVAAISFVATAYHYLFNRTDHARQTELIDDSRNKIFHTIVIAASNQEAETLAGEADLFIESDAVFYFPGYEGIPYEYVRTDKEITIARIKFLLNLRSKKSLLIFTSPEAIMRAMPVPEYLFAALMELVSGRVIEPDHLKVKLMKLGYERTERVEVAGEFCVKGSIIDLFPIQNEQPVRIEFFDDTIESMRFFDPVLQIGLEEIDKCLIPPVGEMVFSEEEIKKLAQIIRDEKSYKKSSSPQWLRNYIARDGNGEDMNSGEYSVISQTHHDGLIDIFPLVQKKIYFLDCFDVRPNCIISSKNMVLERFSEIEREFKSMFEKVGSDRICLPPSEILSETLPDKDENVNQLIYLERFSHSVLIKSGAATDSNTFRDSPLLAAEVFRGRIERLRDLIVEIFSENGIICLTSPYESQLKRMAGVFASDARFRVRVIDADAQEGAPDLTETGTVWLYKSNLRNGWSFPLHNFYIWSDADIFGKTYSRRARFKKLSSTPLTSFIDLKENDYIVHTNHGVGRFKKLERVTAAGRERDFLVLEYRDKDKLYVPLDQISLIQKYIAPTDRPRLDSLGKASFKRIKERVEQKVETLARDLIKLYAIRLSRKGYAFPPDTIWQEEFEAQFQYEETPDQITALEAVKEDMETGRPMDRLICGDVGFGKTEIAIRAVFKAALSGRQSALICPTTILALQHFNTFRERFRNYPIKVDWISRFRSYSEIKRIKANLQSGNIDVVIGTHALFSRDIRFKNLGLLIVDEEQRFGVAHKEAIKNIKQTVDVLTLTATPIPRTLHMSLVGIRDISIMQKPPQDRLPIQTVVMEDSDSFFEEIIRREVNRNGQVFYLHNRINTIDNAVQRLQRLLPDVSYSILHGQMLEEEIEDTLMSFLDRKFSVLITTTIIESGIDMPNVNTLVVDRADTFGLSQLYQIRGRVGRSNRQAYACFFYPRGHVLNEKAMQRLNAIQEHQELGSGFKIAMRDLEIRGAGNILGREQSGEIMDVGFELYVKLLQGAVRRLQGEQLPDENRCSVSLDMDYYLSEKYIDDTRQRIEFYKRFEGALTIAEVNQIADEMIARFSSPPVEAANFVLMERIRTLATSIGLVSIIEDANGRFRFKVGDTLNVPIDHVLDLIKNNDGLGVLPGNSKTMFFNTMEADESRHRKILEILLNIARPLDPAPV